jgi:uncharacterized RDD family membrane protein YckC
MFDTVRDFETPEGIDLQLHVAGPVVRALAWSVDALIRMGIYIVLGIALGQLGQFGMGVMMICVFLLEWFYPVFFEVLRNGATPGKRSFGLRVVNDNGTPVSWGPSITRNLLRTADFAPMFYGFGLAAMLLSRDFKRLGDMAAGTLVIYAATDSPVTDIPAATPGNLPVPLSVSEQRAILDFAERSQLLSPQRREELAEVLLPLTGQTGEAGVQKLYAYANWLHGARQAT